ncbi:glycosyl hydrolase 53 family protein [Ruania suaedae]|uniref:glycosyl hydrolase 53 family protein n=1 Tax=Ruania suaedae TaxID=2897774 RepID=UPI001E35834B|nr:glycosyl hydrolase 53 family protein [Ruania suaedae]UFU02547.1 glycosyl hydrolase 53 family protein [Ruania suaedae]
MIDPIESNLAEKDWVSATASTASDDAALAIDQDESTVWSADGAVTGQWLALDLGGAYDNVRKIEVLFADPTAVHQFEIQVSTDGAQWTTVQDSSENTEASAGATALLTEPGVEYVRVHFTDASPGAEVGVRELRAYNYLREEIVLGADMSWVDDDVASGREFWVNPLEEDRGAGPHLLDVVQDRGMDYVRLRVWNEPRSEWSGNPVSHGRQGPERTLEVAQWVKGERDMGLGIDYHYSDSWSDPSKQPKPLAWAELEFDELKAAMYDYTYDHLQELIAQGTVPDKVAVGNEIINGFMWGSENEHIGGTAPAYWVDQSDVYQSQPGGGLLWDYWNSEDPAERELYLQQWERFSELVGSGISAVRDVSADNGEDIEVEIHVIIGKDSDDKTMEFWDQLLPRLNAQGQDVDVLAHSYYPEWHGTIDYYESALNAVVAAHPGYKMDIAETSYPASGGGGEPMPNATYPRTVQGQADFIQRVFQIANDIPDNRGEGVLTWEPSRWQSMFTPVPGMENTSQPNASIDVYNKSTASHVRQDRVQLTAVQGESAELPGSVPVLDTGTEEISQAPVSWGQVSTADVGTVTVTGQTEFGPVTAVITVVEELLEQPTGSSDATQTIVATLEEAGGALVLSVDPQDRVVELPTFELTSDALAWVTSGELRPVTVTDTRAGAPGWSVSAQVTDFTAASGDSFTGSALGWEPTVLTQPAAGGVVDGPAVAPGGEDGGGLAISQTLALAPSGSGVGTTQLGADLDLRAPTDTQPGAYTALITFTAM